MGKWIVLGLLLAGCSSSSAPPISGSTPTFHRDVEPIVQAHCQSCHTEGGLAPFPLVTYAEVSDKAELVAIKTANRTMPPWDAIDTPDCKPPFPWKHDERLTDAQIATIQAWKDAGKPEGDPSQAPAPIDRHRSLARTDIELAPDAPYTASGDRDEFRCFVLDPKLALGAYIKGMQIVPGNNKVVHHAVVIADPKRAALTRGPIGSSYECSGGAMFTSDQYILDVWTPGVDPIELPQDVSMAVGPNALFIMQIHYSPGGKTAAPDTTKVQIELGLTKPPYLLFTAGIGNFPASLPNGDGLQPGPDDGATPQFKIPAGVKGHTETMLATMPQNVPTGARIYGVMGHEHLAGTNVKVELAHATGDSMCLLNDRWNFHWQRMYAYDAPMDKLPTLAVGDKIRVTCTYDNTMDNTILGSELAARGMPIHDIVLGEQTLDEMCLAIPQVIIPHP